MKRVLFFLILIGVFFAGTFGAARWKDLTLVSFLRPTSSQELLDHHFRPHAYPIENRFFTIVITGFNNGASVEKTLHSVFSQNYENYRVIYIDDASTDGSFDLASSLIYDSRHLMQVTLVRNEERLGPLANLVRAVRGCPDHEIIVVLEGEDWLAHEWVLQRLNSYYADPDLWLTFGQYRDYPTFQLGICRPFRLSDLQQGGFRNHPFISSHLKTFYAALFQRIQETDLVYQGKFLSSNGELAYMIPMLEMAKDHFQFIPEILCVSQRSALPKEDRGEQLRTEKFVRNQTTYFPLKNCFQKGAQ